MPILGLELDCGKLKQAKLTEKEVDGSQKAGSNQLDGIR
jgi:hypothetical protein